MAKKCRHWRWLCSYRTPRWQRLRTVAPWVGRWWVRRGLLAGKLKSCTWHLGCCAWWHLWQLCRLWSLPISPALSPSTGSCFVFTLSGPYLTHLSKYLTFLGLNNCQNVVTWFIAQAIFVVDPDVLTVWLLREWGEISRKWEFGDCSIPIKHRFPLSLLSFLGFLFHGFWYCKQVKDFCFLFFAFPTSSWQPNSPSQF